MYTEKPKSPYDRQTPLYLERSTTKSPYTRSPTPKLYDMMDKYKSKKHEMKDRHKKLDISISNSGNSGLSVTRLS